MHQKKIRHHYEYWLAFLLPFILMLGTYIFQKVYPFGNNTIASEDMINQYLAIMTYFKHNVMHPSNLLYSYQISLGGNFFSVLTYYLMCPFNLLAMLFSEEYIPLFYAINLLVDVGLIGLTTFTYLRKSIFLNRNLSSSHSRYQTGWQLFFATIFPFASFFTNYYNCMMWMDALILMPFVLLGLDRILYSSSKRTWLYWVSLTLLLITNYYIGVIVLVFLFLLMFFWVIEQLCELKWQEVLRKGLTVLILTIASILGAAFVMWPSYLAQLNVDQAKMANADLWAPTFRFRDFWPALLNGKLGIILQGPPLIFIGLLTLILFLAYFFARKISLRERILAGCFVAFLLVSCYYTFFYMIWHSMSMPNGYHHRESFVLVFVMICLAYRGLAVFANRHPLAVFLPIIIGICILNISLQLAYPHLFLSGQLLHNVIFLVLLTVGIIMTFFFPKWGICLMMLTSLTNIMMYNTDVQNEKFHLMKNSPYTKVVSENQMVFDRLKEYDPSFYRVGTTSQINACDPLLYGYNGVQSYLSQQPTVATDYLSMLGYYQKLGWIRWSGFNNGSTGMINDMLGIKYVVKSDKVIADAVRSTGSPLKGVNSNVNVPDLEPVLKSKHTTVYENPNAFPLAFGAYDGKRNNSIFSGAYYYIPESNPFIAYGWMFKRLSGKKWLYAVQPGFKLHVSKKKAVATGIVNQTGDVYCYLTKSRGIIANSNKPAMPIYVNGKEVAEYSNKNADGENGIVYLGHFRAGQTIKIEIKNADQDKFLKKDHLYVAVENQHMIHQIYQEATTGIGTIKAVGPKISIQTTRKFSQKRMIISVPYDRAWQIKVDGKSVRIRKALGGLVGIKLSPGKHQITMHYRVDGFKLGIIISLITILCLVFFEFYKYQNNKQIRKH